MKKKNLFFTILAIVIIVVAILFIFRTSQSYFPGLLTGKETYTVSQVSSDSNSYTYSMFASPYYNYATNVAQKAPSTILLPLDQDVVFDGVNGMASISLPSDVQIGVLFPATATVSGTAGWFPDGYGYATAEVPVTIINQTATCIVNSRSSITCTIKGLATTQDPSITPSETNGIRIGLLNAQITWQSNFLKNGIQCIDNSYCSSNQICQSNQCTIYTPTPVYPGPTPTPKGFFASFSQFFSAFGDFWHSVMKSLGISQQIYGSNTTIPGQQIVYSLNTTAPLEINQPGYRTWVFGKWGVVDSTNTTITSGAPTEITNGLYNPTVVFTAPSNPGNFALIDMITQINATWTSSTGWVMSNETLINTEALNIVSQAPQYSGGNPTSSSFADSISKFFSNIWSSIKSIFGFR